MQIVIDVDEEDYELLTEHYTYELGHDFSDRIFMKIENGTPLPKGHGRLIDEKDVIENICEAHGCYEVNNCKSKSDNFCGAWDVVEKAPTIIEADISGKEKNVKKDN